MNRIPPQNTEAEQAILGSILLLPETYDEVRLVCSEKDFYRPEHQIIFSAMDSTSDIVLLTNKLKASGKLDSVGGPAYLAQLMDVTPSATMAVKYARLVKEASRKRSFIAAAGEMVQSCYQDIPFDYIASQLETEAFKLTEQETTTDVQTIGDIALSEMKRIEQVQDGTIEPGIMTGFTDLDFMLSGLKPADLIIMAGRPSMGKSALAFNIAYNISGHGIPVGVFSVEMSNQMNGQRAISSLSGINSKAFMNRGSIRDNQWPVIASSIGKLSMMPLFIDDTGGLHVSELRSRARRMVRKNGVKLIAVDYLQMLRGDGKQGEQMSGNISGELKAMAKELGVPVIAVAQLSRALEQRSDKRPMLSDLRDSGRIEQDADVIIFVYRDEYYNKNPSNPKRGMAELIIGKQRNGPTGMVEVAFLEHSATFKNLAR